MPYLTLSMENQFTFTCPIFNADVQMRSCVIVREKVYRGERFNTRKGCQACVSASKCPAAEIIRRIAFNHSSATDHCASKEPTKGKLPADILENISPKLVTDTILNSYGVPSSERDLIESSRARIDTQAKTAPRKIVEARETIRSTSPQQKRKFARETTVVATPKPNKSAEISKAAMSGDMAAAINQH